MISSNIETLFTQYRQKYPMYTKEAIVDIMLDDGVITFNVAKKIMSGESLFLIDNNFASKFESSGDIDMTAIMGGSFHLHDNAPKTNFNREIEPTIQPEIQGDCWLLSDINSLCETDWGRQAIHDAIIPDEDGSGGVTIRFKGSPLEQKDIHITAEQIEKARSSGNYSAGDDDMLAFELATEMTFREMVKSGLGERVHDDETLKSYGTKYRSFIFAGIKTDKFDQYPISELLGIKTEKIDFWLLKEHPGAEKDIDKVLKFATQNKDNLSGWCDFALLDGYGDAESKDYIHGSHAYAIKNINYGKEVVLSDPHYSDYEIKVQWNTFIDLVKSITFSAKDDKTAQQLVNSLPSGYDEQIKSSNEKFEKARDEILKRLGNN